MNAVIQPKTAQLVPFALKGAPALIEKAFPATKVSFEAQKERKAGSGQTLTALGCYWKGRKPLILVRAIVLGCLLPNTSDAEADLAIFESLMGFDIDGLARRAVVQNTLKPKDIAKMIRLDNPWNYFKATIKKGTSISEEEAKAHHFPMNADYLGVSLQWKRGLDNDSKAFVITKALETLPSYEARASLCKRPEEVDQRWLYAPAWQKVNAHYAHLGINANTFDELIDQLGRLRYGKRPRVGDTFSGGGSIPFEAARLGCDVYASDLNPIACMLTWGSLHIVGASPAKRAEIETAQEEVANAVDKEIAALGIEHDAHGNRAKAYLYCLETKCPETGWAVPMSPSWIISKPHAIVAKLLPDYTNKRFDIEIKSGASKEEMSQAEKGTVKNGELYYELNGNTYRTAIKTLRGDYKDTDGKKKNRLRQWNKEDIKPKNDDVFYERLYAIQWIEADTLARPRPSTFFAAVTSYDLEREGKVEALVSKKLGQWQESGLIPDMSIEHGSETTRLSRERGWTHWHHLFNPRQLLSLGYYFYFAKKSEMAAETLSFAPDGIQRGSRLCMFDTNPGLGRMPKISPTFTDQALNPGFNYGVRGWVYWRTVFEGAKDIHDRTTISDLLELCLLSKEAKENNKECDLFITDPPYADAVNYHEITEFFIAWLRKNKPSPFDQWTWDSRRKLAIKGSGDDFRRGMVDAYKAMANQMPDNGMQCVMFTHQDSGVWSDMVGIFWATGLQVVSAWYIATETTSELKKGGYVQGTVILMLRKRPTGERKGFTRRIYPAVHKEVESQIEEMLHLNQKVEDHTGEPVFNDADLQMAGYAAALKVLTAYTEIGGEDVTKFALRPRQKGERTVVDDIVQQASETANGLLVPDGLKRDSWQSISGIQRFYLRMLDIETTGASKLDNYQNFAKAFRVEDFNRVMASTAANGAKLKQIEAMTSRDLMDTTELGATHLGHLMTAIQQLLNDVDIKVVVKQLSEDLPDYYENRGLLIDMCRYLSVKVASEAVRDWAEILSDRISNEQLA